MAKLAKIPVYKGSSDTYLDPKSGMYLLRPDAISKTINEGIKNAHKKYRSSVVDATKYRPKPVLAATCDDQKKTTKKAEFLAGVCPVRRKGAYHGTSKATTGTHKPKAQKPQKHEPSLAAGYAMVHGVRTFVTVFKVKTKEDVRALIINGDIGPTTEVQFVTRAGKTERLPAIVAIEALPSKTDTKKKK